MDNKLKFELTTPEADLVVRGLGKLPYDQSFALITNLQNQFQVQTAKTEKKPKVPAAEKK